MNSLSRFRGEIRDFDKENEVNRPKNDFSDKTDREGFSCRLPVKILPTYIFNLEEVKPTTSSKYQISTPLKKSTSKSSLKKIPKKNCKTESKPKKVLNRSVLTEKKILHSDERKKNLDVKKLIKAVSKHALMCPGFKKELNKDFLCF